MNILPINGRVAIVDDVLEQAQPLMQELSKRRIPFEYYDGKPENFPQKETYLNDIRVLFLDLNLMGNQVFTTKQLYPIINASLVSLISSSNFPYVLVCWTRTDNAEQYNEIIEKIKVDFKDNPPIDILPLPKLDYFSLSGEKTVSYDDKIEHLFMEIEDILSRHTAFNNILLWENNIHNATNNSVIESLSVIAKENDWDESANWIFTQWAKAYAGNNYSTYKDSGKLMSSFHTLDSYLFEKIEEEISKENDDTKFEENCSEMGLSLLKFNETLLFSFGATQAKEPGRIVIDENNKDCQKMYRDILNFSINRNSRPQDLSNELSSANEEDSKKIINNYFKEKQREIEKDWDVFKLVINPVCDFAQNKIKRNRVIPGIFILNEYRSIINDKTDALFVSPPFYYRSKNNNYFFVLDFRYFMSEIEDLGVSNLKLKQQVVGEILSKLSRHINRQGILSIDNHK
jgi:hypothetical protein